MYVPLHPPEFNFDPGELEATFKQRPKALILCNPSNPCGKVFTFEELKTIARDVGVGAVPGSSFFRENVNYLIRLHFAKKDETLYEALNRLEDLRKKYRRADKRREPPRPY